MTALPDMLCCSFCGQANKDVRKMIAGVGSYICDQCIQLCHETISEPNDDPDELVLFNQVQALQIVSKKLGVPLKSEHLSRCSFSIRSPGGGGAPSICATGSGKWEGRDFYFVITGQVWGNEHGLVFNHQAKLVAQWE